MCFWYALLLAALAGSVVWVARTDSSKIKLLSFSRINITWDGDVRQQLERLAGEVRTSTSIALPSPHAPASKEEQMEQGQQGMVESSWKRC